MCYPPQTYKYITKHDPPGCATSPHPPATQTRPGVVRWDRLATPDVSPMHYRQKHRHPDGVCVCGTTIATSKTEHAVQAASGPEAAGNVGQGRTAGSGKSRESAPKPRRSPLVASPTLRPTLAFSTAATSLPRATLRHLQPGCTRRWQPSMSVRCVRECGGSPLAGACDPSTSGPTPHRCCTVPNSGSAELCLQQMRGSRTRGLGLAMEEGGESKARC